MAACRLPAHHRLVPLCHRALPRGQAHPLLKAAASLLVWGCFCSHDLLTVVFFATDPNGPKSCFPWHNEAEKTEVRQPQKPS